MTSRIEAGADASLTYRLKALNRVADHMNSELSRDKLGIPYPEAGIIAAIGTYGPRPCKNAQNGRPVTPSYF